MTVRVVRFTQWQGHHGGSGDMGNIGCGTWGQLSECQLDDGFTFYVREAMQLSTIERFAMSSGARQGVKRGAHNPGRQVLELAAPARWEECAAAVSAADSSKRSVVANRRFTVAWARELFARAVAGQHPAKVCNVAPTANEDSHGAGARPARRSKRNH